MNEYEWIIVKNARRDSSGNYGPNLCIYCRKYPGVLAYREDIGHICKQCLLDGVKAIDKAILEVEK